MGAPTFPLQGRVVIFNTGDVNIFRSPKRTDVVLNEDGVTVQAIRYGSVLATGTMVQADEIGGGMSKLTMQDGVYWMVRAGCGCSGG